MTTKTQKWLFAPSGLPIVRPVAYSFNMPNIEINQIHGTAELGSFDDFPDFQMLSVPGYGAVLSDSDSDEWLEQHCRLVEVDDGFSPWEFEDQSLLEWPPEIIADCARVAKVAQLLWLTKLLCDWAPTDMRDDGAFSAAISGIIEARVKAEIAELTARINAFRAGRVETTSLIEPEPEDEIEAALGLMRGGTR